MFFFLYSYCQEADYLLDESYLKKYDTLNIDIQLYGVDDDRFLNKEYLEEYVNKKFVEAGIVVEKSDAYPLFILALDVEEDRFDYAYNIRVAISDKLYDGKKRVNCITYEDGYFGYIEKQRYDEMTITLSKIEGQIMEFIQDWKNNQ